MIRDKGIMSGSLQAAEIDINELVKELWSQKLLILLVMVVVVALAAAYAFLSAPVYVAKSSLLPPSVSDIAGYNLGRQEASLKALSVDDVYKSFARNLFSDSLRRNFFQSDFLPSLSEEERRKPQDKLWEGFNKLVSISAPSEERPGYLEVSIQYRDPELSAKWARKLVSLASERTKKEMQRNVMAEIRARINSLERRIDTLRTTAEQRRDDRIVVLEEALVVASRVGAESPQVTMGRTSSSSEISGFVDGSLMYMRGANAIRAELDVLRNRKGMDPFIPELRGIQEEMQFLKAIDVQPENVAVFSLDDDAETPQTPIKPRKAFVILLGLASGFVLGVLMVFARRLFG